MGPDDRHGAAHGLHLNVNPVDAYGADPEMTSGVEDAARGWCEARGCSTGGWLDWADNRAGQSPYSIDAFTEIKTVWYPKRL